MKIILCGYNWTGCKALELLLKEKHDVFVYTHHAEMQVADLEGYCIKKKIPYSLERISVSNIPFIPDLICSVYYRYIISSEIIKCVKGKIFNLHPALLPQYRGCSSLTWAIINGEEKVGYTYHYIDNGIDTGNIIIQKQIDVEPFDTQLTLYNRVMHIAMEDFLIALHKVSNNYEGKKQIGSGSIYKRGCPRNGIMDEELSFEEKERFVRAMIYPPYPCAKYKGKEINSVTELYDLVK